MNLSERTPQLFHLVIAYLPLVDVADCAARAEQAALLRGPSNIFEKLGVRNNAVIEGLQTAV